VPWQRRSTAEQGLVNQLIQRHRLTTRPRRRKCLLSKLNRVLPLRVLQRQV
jgi:hypothetical protein